MRGVVVDYRPRYLMMFTQLCQLLLLLMLLAKICHKTLVRKVNLAEIRVPQRLLLLAGWCCEAKERWSELMRTFKQVRFILVPPLSALMCVARMREMERVGCYFSSSNIIKWLISLQERSPKVFQLILIENNIACLVEGKGWDGCVVRGICELRGEGRLWI